MGERWFAPVSTLFRNHASRTIPGKLLLRTEES